MVVTVSSLIAFNTSILVSAFGMALTMRLILSSNEDILSMSAAMHSFLKLAIIAKVP